MPGTATEATPMQQDGSLDSAGRALMDLLSDDSETEQTTETPPEQRPKKETTHPPKPAAEQAPAAEEEPSAPEGEQAKDNETDESPEVSAQPRVFTVKINGQDHEVTEDEILRGYSRTQDYTQKTQALAEARKQFEATEVAPVRVERAQYRDALTDLRKAIEAQTPAEPNWAQVRASLPLEDYVKAKDAWEERSKQIAAVKAEEQRVNALEQQDAAKGFHEFLQAEHQALVSARPEFGDKEKGPAIREELTEFAQARGFTPEQVHQVTDHRLVLLLHDAMQYHKAQTKAPEIRNKIERAIESSKPGASSSTRASPNKLANAKARLEQSGSIDDAGAAIAHLI